MKRNFLELLRAQLDAAVFGQGITRKGITPAHYAAPRPKTGRFTGYWNSGHPQWKGSFLEGHQTGYWKYFSSAGNNTIIHEQIHLTL